MKGKKMLLAAAALLLCGCAATAETSSAVVTETAAAAAENTQTVEQTQPEAETHTAGEQAGASRDIFAMDTYMTVTAYGHQSEEAADAAVAEIERLDALLSTGIETSEVAQINASGSGVLSEDAAVLMEKSLELYQETNGIFDVAIYPVMKLWRFTDENFQVPEEADLKAAMALADPKLIDYDPQTQEISFKEEGVMLDFGAIAKGYTSSRVMDIFRSYGVTSGMINLGGNVQLLGTKTDGSAWRVGIQDPEDTSAMLGVLSVSDKAVITSGGYERYFEQDGVRYHHIIDPSDGYPAYNGLTSVTIVSEDGMLADGLSTSLFIMGPEKAIAFWQAHSNQFDAVLVTDEDEIYVTEGIADAFSSDGPFDIVRIGE